MELNSLCACGGRRAHALCSARRPSVLDRRRRGRSDASELYRESAAIIRIDEFFPEITRVTDDNSRLHPSRLLESMLGAYLIGTHDTRHVLIKCSVPHDLAGRDIFVAVNHGRDVIAAA